MRLSVNFSARQFQQPTFIGPDVAEILKETNLDPRWLELELTESSDHEGSRSWRLKNCTS